MEDLPVPTRIGGFGGEAGFRAYLGQAGITAVLDMTHPFASRITERTARVCADLGLPYLQYLRPPWSPEAADMWVPIKAPEDAARLIPEDATVFLAVGRNMLPAFAGLEGRRVLCRLVQPPTEPFPFEGGEFVLGRPPFAADKEQALFEALGVDWLVVKNAGGQGGRGKLDAARALGLPVAMLERPQMPDAERATTLGEALAWVDAL